MILERILGRRFQNDNRGPLSDHWYQPCAYPSVSGQSVTPHSANGLSAYYACIRNISEDIAKFPCPTYRSDGDGRYKIPDHRVTRLLNVEPNPDMTAIGFRETLTQWAMGWGNGYAQIARNAVGYPIALWPTHPSRVVPKRDGRGIYYQVKNLDGSNSEVRSANMLHIHGMGDDGIMGYSVAQIGSSSLGRALAAQTYSAAFFAGGGAQRVAVKLNKPPSDKTRKNLRDGFADIYGGADNHTIGVLWEGADVVNIGIPPEQAQMLETMTFTVEDVARWFRCALTKIGHFLRAQGWSTLEQLNRDYVVDTLQPWAVRWEQEIGRKLFMRSEADLYVSHNFGKLLEGDVAAQTNHFNTMRRIGVYTTNDILRLMDMNPIGDEGDIRVIESNLQNMEMLIHPDQQPADPQLPADPIPDAPPEDIPADTQNTNASISVALDAARQSLEHEYARAVRKEAKACRLAFRKHMAKQDSDGFRAWLDGFYEGWPKDLTEMVGPSAKVWCLLSMGSADGLAEIWERHAVSSRAQLLAAWRDDGPGGVETRLNEWETYRECEVLNAKS